MPANAIWPSESWPPQPVSTVTDTAQIANARMIEYVRWCADWCMTSGSDDRGDEREAGDDLRHAPHPPDLAQPLGHRRDTRREREALAAGVVGAAHARDEHEHDDEQHELHEPGRRSGS